MTPLALEIARQMFLPQQKRWIEDRCNILSKMGDIHCFEVSDAIELCAEAMLNIVRMGGMDETLAFLPATKTWIEWKSPHGHRFGVLFDGSTSYCDPVSYFAVKTNYRRLIAFAEVYKCSLKQNEEQENISHDELHRYLDKLEWGSTGIAIGALPLINTPRIIGRRQHMPHRGLERKLLRQRVPIGQFPLHAWTEILLRVSPPKDASGDPSNEAHLTGQKALHFCRAHLRVRCGKLELVRGHWRGDASLGIKRSRYRLEA